MKILTLNLRNNADRWNERFPLVVREIQTELPDIIAFQEVSLAIDQANMIKDALNPQLKENLYQSHTVRGWGLEESLGESILTRYPQIDYEETRLPEGGRVAQLLSVYDGASPWSIVNTHLHHLPKDNEVIRFPQIRFLIDWMSKFQKGKSAQILLGDMNATPKSKTIEYILRSFSSAYSSCHGQEPELTFPTPLVQVNDEWNSPRTIDYIFFSSSTIKLQESHLAFASSHPDDQTLFPSDHYGIVATMSSKT